MTKYGEGARSNHSFMVLMLGSKDTHFVEWASEKWDHRCKAMTKSLFPGARISLYLVVFPTSRKETKKSVKCPKSLISREQQVEFLHQSQRFIFTSLTRGLPVHFQSFLGQESQFILRQTVYCWKARIVGKSLITLDNV